MCSVGRHLNYAYAASTTRLPTKSIIRMCQRSGFIEGLMHAKPRNLYSYNLLAVSLSGERSLPAPRQSPKGFQRQPHVLLKDCRSERRTRGSPAQSAAGRRRASSRCETKVSTMLTERTMRHLLISYVDNQIMPQSDKFDGNRSYSRKLAKNPPREVNVSELGKLAQGAWIG
jgi:hypothetical protein